MNRIELIEKLDQFVKFPHDRLWRGQIAYAKFLAEYLRRNQYYSEKFDQFWTIEQYVHKIAFAAFEELRTSTEKYAAQARKEWEADVGHEIPVLCDLGASNGINQTSALHTNLAFLLKDITGQEWVYNRIMEYGMAQHTVLQQAFDKFLRHVYQKGMYNLTLECAGRGMTMHADKTDLRTFVCAGRIMFTFARLINPDKPSYYKIDGDLICNEDSITFVASDECKHGLNSGMNSTDADLLTSLDMINTIIKAWPANPEGQKNIYKINKNVSIG